MTEPRDQSVAQSDVATGPGRPPPAHQTELRTFLIADLRGYTTYTREHGDEAGAAVAARFAELVTEVVAGHDGFLLELRGDEALVVFVSARKALRAALALQDRFAQAELALKAGIGLDAGEAIPVGDGYRGTALNLAARLCAVARAGETLASEAVIHLAAKMEGIAYVDARAVRLKGYSDAVRVVDVVPADRVKGRRIVDGRRTQGFTGRRFAVAGTAVVVLLVVALTAAALGGGFFAPAATGGLPSPSDVAAGSPSIAPTDGASAAPTGSPDPLDDAELPLLAFYDGSTGELKTTTSFGSPRNIAFYSAGSFWILGENPKAFNRIDQGSHRVVQSIPVPVVEASGFNFDENSIWVTDLAGPRVVRIDKRTGVVSDFSFASDESDMDVATDIAVGAGSVWLARPDRAELTRMDAETGDVTARIDVSAWGVSFGEGALWYWAAGHLGRIDPVTNERTFDELELGTVGWLGNIYFAGGYAWTAESTTGTLWRVDRSGRRTSFALEPGVAEMASTPGTIWVTNANTGQLTGIDVVTGEHGRAIYTGHATLAVAAGGDELMIAVGPTADEAIAELEGSVLTLSAPGTPWNDPAPDPALNTSWEVRQGLYLTCVHLVNYPDKPAPEGWSLEPEAADGMPTVSADGRTYTFKIRPGFMFSPPSNEPLTAETFRATIERTLSPVLADDAPGPEIFSDIEGVAEFRDGTADHVSGIVADDDLLTITLQAPAPDFLARLTLSIICPVPARTPALRSGLDPDPPVSGAGPYYVASTIRRRLVVLMKNPNYHGSRPQPFDAIAIRLNTAPATAITEVQRGVVDAAVLGGSEPLTGPQSALASEWGPASANAAAGDQRWFGAPRLGVDYVALNPSRDAFSDPDVRRAVALVLDRTAIASIWITGPTDSLLPPGVPGSVFPAPPVAAPNLEAARALMNGRTFEVTMQGFPIEWDCGACRDFEVAVTGQLKSIGINVTVRHDEDFPAGALEPGSNVDMVPFGTGSEIPDLVDIFGELHENIWLGEANLAELTRLEGLSGQARTDGAIAFARRLVEDEVLVLPAGYPVFPMFLSERIGCGFVQPAIGAVDLLSLCIEGDAAPTSSSNP